MPLGTDSTLYWDVRNMTTATRPTATYRCSMSQPRSCRKSEQDGDSSAQLDQECSRYRNRKNDSPKRPTSFDPDTYLLNQPAPAPPIPAVIMPPIPLSPIGAPAYAPANAPPIPPNTAPRRPERIAPARFPPAATSSSSPAVNSDRPSEISIIMLRSISTGRTAQSAGIVITFPFQNKLNDIKNCNPNDRIQKTRKANISNFSIHTSLHPNKINHHTQNKY